MRRSIPSSAAVVLLLAVLLAPAPAVGGAGTWTPIAPERTYGWTVAADPQTGQVYASTYYSGVYRSDDRGMTWVSASHGLPTSFLSEKILKASGGIAYAVVIGSLYRSIDAGLSWESVPTLSNLVADLAISPAAPRTVYAARGRQVFRSDDGGATWPFAGESFSTEIAALAVDPGHPDLLYAWTSEGAFRSSRDGGAHWTITAIRSPGDRNNLVVDPGAPAILYVVENGKLLRSLDSGVHWSRIDAALPADGVAVSLAALGPPVPRLYAAVQRFREHAPTLSILYVSGDHGTTWRLLKRVAIGGAHALAVDPSHPRRLYVAAGTQGLQWSATAGAQWAQGRGLLDVEGLDVAPDPKTAGTLYLLETSKFQKSVDGGSTWTVVPLGTTSFLNRLAVDPTTAGTLYAMSTFNLGSPYSNLYKSVDAGETFQPLALPSGMQIEDLGIDPQDSRHLIAAGWVAIPQLGFHLQAARSTDGGSTWTSFADPLVEPQALGRFSRVRFDPFHSQTVYLLGDRSFRSTDGGSTWVSFAPYQVLTGVPFSGVTDLAIDPFQPNVLYAGTPSLLKSVDGGQSWQRVPGLPDGIQSLTVDPRRPGTLYAITPNQEVWMSTDGAAHWTSIQAGLPDAPIRTLAVDPFQPGHLFAAVVSHGGLYSYTIP